MPKSLQTPALIILLAIMGCRMGLEDPTPPPPQQGADSSHRATPPQAETPSGEALYQLLYAGEGGQVAGSLGDRVRALAFLRSIDLDKRQLQGLLDLIEAHNEMLTRDRQAREALDLREQEQLGPAYLELEALLASPSPLPDDRLAELGRKIEAGRMQAGTDTERQEHSRRIATHIRDVAGWVATLRPDQHERLHHCLFLLQRRLGPFTNPGDYGDLVEPLWSGGDFASLARTVRRPDERPLDLGGLWSLENSGSTQDPRIRGLQLQALVVMALEEPALAGAAATLLSGYTTPEEAAQGPTQ